MWKSFREPLLFLSIGMNLAFLIVLGLFYVPGLLDTPRHDYRKHEKHKKFNDHPDRDPGWYFYTQKLGVSDTQWTNLRPDMEQFHGRAYEICRRIHRLKNDILALIEDPAKNESKIQAKTTTILDLKKKKHQMFVDYMDRKKQYLTRDQEERFFGMLQKHRDCDKHARFLEDRGPDHDGNH